MKQYDLNVIQFSYSDVQVLNNNIWEMINEDNAW